MKKEQNALEQKWKQTLPKDKKVLYHDGRAQLQLTIQQNHPQTTTLAHLCLPQHQSVKSANFLMNPFMSLLYPVRPATRNR